MKTTKILCMLGGTAACAVAVVRKIMAAQQARLDDWKYFQQQLATMEDEGGIVTT